MFVRVFYVFVCVFVCLCFFLVFERVLFKGVQCFSSLVHVGSIVLTGFDCYVDA